MNETLLKARGVFWRDLSQAEKKEITTQMPRIQFDPNYVNYRFYYSQFHKWIILNANCLPMQTSKVRFD